jgi:hypothetical protein
VTALQAFERGLGSAGRQIAFRGLLVGRSLVEFALRYARFL